MVEEENNNGVVVRGGDTEARLERIWVKPVQTQYFVYPILGPKIPNSNAVCLPTFGTFWDLPIREKQLLYCKGYAVNEGLRWR